MLAFLNGVNCIHFWLNFGSDYDVKITSVIYLVLVKVIEHHLRVELLNEINLLMKE